MNLKNRRIYPSFRFLNMDTKRQIESIKKLAQIENISILFTAHTGYTYNFAYTMEFWRIHNYEK